MDLKSNLTFLILLFVLNEISAANFDNFKVISNFTEVRGKTQFVIFYRTTYLNKATKLELSLHNSI